MIIASLPPVMSAQGPSSFLFWLSSADITTYPPIAKSEGICHGISDVGPAQYCQWNPQNGVKNRHDLGYRGLWRNVTITLDGQWTYIIRYFC